MTTCLITGAAGFIGGHFTRLLAEKRPAVKLLALDKLTYAANLSSIQPLIDQGRLTFIQGDIADATLVNRIFHDHKIDAVAHLAAETHVDRSIAAPAPFITTNIVGTQVLLDAARAHKISRFLQVSTDEVYGSLPLDRPDLKFTEDSPLAPSSPYSASKAAADLLARAAFHTHGTPVLITRASNNFGPYQFPEKLIPLFVTRLLNNQPVPLYGDGLNVRDWLHVEDHCHALLAVLERGTPGQIYNIGAGNELSNRDLTRLILDHFNKDWNTSVQIVPDRPGHDRRYAVDSSKITHQLTWKPQQNFATVLKSTLDWYAARRSTGGSPVILSGPNNSIKPQSRRNAEKIEQDENDVCAHGAFDPNSSTLP